MKICITCNVSKPFEHFAKCKPNKDGYVGKCKECKVKYDREYKRTLEGVLTAIYNKQIANSRKRGTPLPMYEKHELQEWIVQQTNYKSIFKAWEDSNFLTDNKPSIDRLDDSKGYSFDNIQLITWKENSLKANQAVKDGTATFKNVPNIAVHQFTKEGKFVQEYYSITEAARNVEKGNKSNITQCCRGNQRTASGFVWKYADNNTVS